VSEESRLFHSDDHSVKHCVYNSKLHNVLVDCAMCSNLVLALMSSGGYRELFLPLTITQLTTETTYIYC